MHLRPNEEVHSLVENILDFIGYNKSRDGTIMLEGRQHCIGLYILVVVLDTSTKNERSRYFVPITTCRLHVKFLVFTYMNIEYIQ